MGRVVTRPLPGQPYGPREQRRARSYRAYVPSLLASFEYRPSATAMERVISAAETVAALEVRASGPTAKMSRLVSLLSRSEGIGSSTIEHYSASMRRLVSDSAVEADTHRLTSSRIILDGIAAVEHGVRALGDHEHPISVGGIEDLQRQLMRHHSDHECGYRTGFVQIGGRAGLPESADFVPPLADEVALLMRDLCDYINTPNGQHPLIRAAIAHVQFETIHPFPDGNGRTGRVLFQAMLRREGLTISSVLPISLAIVQSPAVYVTALRALQEEVEHPSPGALDSLVSHFADLASDAATKGSQLIIEADLIHDEMVKQTRSQFRSDSCAENLTDLLATRLGVTIAHAAREVGVNHDAVRLVLEKMSLLGIISSRRAGRSRVYYAHRLTDLVERAVGARLVDADDVAMNVPEVAREPSEGAAPRGRPRAKERCGAHLRNGGVCMRAAGHSDGKHRGVP